MTSWKRRGIVLAAISGQLLAGTLSGRAIYLAHCSDHAQHQTHEHESEGCDPEDDCFASLGHDHVTDLGHAHRCRCPHFHVQYELRQVERFRLGNVRGSLSSFAPKSPHPIARAMMGSRSHARDALPVSDSDPPQTLRALRATRLLV
jgi:hypothetical protein